MPITVSRPGLEAHNRLVTAESSEGDENPRLYNPSQPGYRIKRLNDAVNFAACQRDHVPCAWCGATLDRHVFDTYCPTPPRRDLPLMPH